MRVIPLFQRGDNEKSKIRQVSLIHILENYLPEMQNLQKAS